MVKMNNKSERELKKPIYKKWWFWIIVIIAILVLGLIFADDLRLLLLPEGGPAARPLN